MRTENGKLITPRNIFLFLMAAVVIYFVAYWLGFQFGTWWHG